MGGYEPAIAEARRVALERNAALQAQTRTEKDKGIVVSFEQSRQAGEDLRRVQRYLRDRRDPHVKEGRAKDGSRVVYVDHDAEHKAAKAALETMQKENTLVFGAHAGLAAMQEGRLNPEQATRPVSSVVFKINGETHPLSHDATYDYSGGYDDGRDNDDYDDLSL